MLHEQRLSVQNGPDVALGEVTPQGRGAGGSPGCSSFSLSSRSVTSSCPRWRPRGGCAAHRGCCASHGCPFPRDNRSSPSSAAGDAGASCRPHIWAAVRCSLPDQVHTPRPPPGSPRGAGPALGEGLGALRLVPPPTSPMPRGGCTQRGRGAEMGRGWRRGRGDPGGGEGLVLGGHSGLSAHGTPEPFLM